MTGDLQDKPLQGLRDLDDIDAVFAALAHPTRRHILQVLAARGGRLTAGDLSARFSHAWPTIPRHLSVLRDAGLVTVDRVGRNQFYALAANRLGDVVALWLRSVGFELVRSSDQPNRRDATTSEMSGRRKRVPRNGNG